MPIFRIETAKSKFTISLLFALLFILENLNSQSTLLLVNQSEPEYLSRLSEIISDINQSFRNNTNHKIEVPDSEERFLPPRDVSYYLEQAYISNYSFVVINNFSISDSNISIESTAYRADNGESVFTLNSSGSISLGLDTKINFIIRKINQKLIDVQKEIEEEKTGAPDETGIFLSVFGEQPPQEIPEIEVPLFINSKYDSQVSIIPNGDGSIKIHYDSLSERLLPLVTDYFASRFSETDLDGDYITIEALSRMGIEGEYSDSQLLLILTIPVDLLKEQRIAFRKDSTLLSSDITNQAPFSFYINLFHNQQWSWDSIGANNEHQFPGSLTFETAFNFRDWVLSADYTLNYPDSSELPSFDITRDFQKISSRLTAGHYSVESRGYQSFGRYQGISFKKMPEISMSPRRENPLYDFTIESPSSVRIYINGILVKSADLDTGRYSLIDFPLAAGVNEVTLKIEDSYGNKEEVDFFVPLAVRGLKRGDMSYSASAGIPPYVLEPPLISGHFIYGFTSFFTGGINFQSDFNSELAGLTLIIPTLAGTIDLEAAQSWSHDNGFGFSALISYYFAPAGNRRLPTFSLFGRYNSPAFYTVGSGGETVPDIAEFKASLSYNLSDFIQIIPRGSIRLGRESNGNSGSVQLGLRKRFSKNISASLDAGVDFPSQGDPIFSASLMLSIQDREKDQSLSIRSATSQQGGDINWNKSFPGSGNPSLSAGLSGLPFNEGTSSTLYARGRNSFNRFNGSLSASLNRSFEGDFSYFAQSRLSSALVFAGKHLAVSRPVSDSFAIIVPQYNLANIDVGVNPNSYGYDSQSDFLGNPVLNNLRSYNAQRVIINVTEPETDIDTELGDSSFFLNPRYRSGTVIYTGTKFNVYLTGRLIDETGSPLPLETGKLTDREGESRLFFTDREGIFYIYGLQRGECEINLNNHPFTLDFRIPEDTEKIFDLGDLTIQRSDR